MTKLHALVHEQPDAEGRPARTDAIRIILDRLRGEKAKPCRDVSAYHRRLYRQLSRADKYGAWNRPKPFL
eukprot:12537225-Alexandrium_andersonii.AAC.1